MASSRQQPKRNPGRNRSRLNTTWLNNAIKSIGAATADTFKDISPTLYSMGSASAKAVSNTASKVRQTRPSIGKLNSAIAGNKYIQVAKKSMDQSIADLKSGNLYNNNRSNPSGSDSFDDFDDMFGDFDSEDSGTTINIVNDSGDSDNGSSIIADAIQKSGAANIKATKASVDAMIALSSTSLETQLHSLERIESGLSDVNTSVRSILQYHEDNTTKFYEDMLAAMEKLGKTVDEGFSNDDGGMESLFNYKGGINGSEYKKYIKKNIRSAIDHSPVGMLLPFLKDDDMINMLASDPIGGITKGVIGGMIPAVVSGTLKELDNTVSNLIPNVMANITKNAKDEKSSKLVKVLGDIFGIKSGKKDNIDLTDRLNNSAVAFDDMTRNSIVEVLPKYARESTAYLRAIAMHVTHKKDGDLLSSTKIFNPKDFTYTTEDKIKKSIADDLQEAITSAFKQADFGKILESAGSDLGDKDKKSFEKALNQFFVQLSSFDAISAADFNLNNKGSAGYKALKGVEGKGKSAKSKKLLTEAIKYMYSNNLGIDTATVANIRARDNYSKKVSEMERNPELSNLLAAGINSNTDLAEFLDQYTGNKAAMGIRKKARIQAEKDAKSQIIKTAHPYMSASSRAAENIKSYSDYQKGSDNPKTGWITNNLVSQNTANKIGAVGGHAKDAVFSVMKGDTKGALDSFGLIFSDIGKTAWTATKEGFFEPLKKTIFGKKDANGKSVGGMLSGLKNSVNDTWKAVVQKVNGKAYTDSEGKVHKVDDMDGTLVGKASNIFKEIGQGVRVRLFGEKDAKKKDKDNPGVISNMIQSLKEGIQGWKEVLFGKDDKDHKTDIENIKKNVIDALPDALLGAGSGAILGAMSGGSLLGALIGGPVGGAVIGMAGGLLSRSDKFKDWLFGPGLDDGNGGKQRIGGFISKKTQDFFEKNKSTMIGGAALGAMKSIVFPNSAGLLTSIVGGPIAGAAIGAGFGVLKNSETFQKFLYGDEESGKRGVIQAFKEAFSGKKDSQKGDNKNVLKALGMGAVGAAGLGLTASLVGKVGLMGAMITPGGPLGAAIIGAAVGIGASSEKFRHWIFGTKDEKDGKRKGGLVQKFGNYVQVELLQPMKSKVMDIVEDASTSIKYDILENIRIPFIAVADKVKEKIESGIKKVGDLGQAITKNVGSHIIKPIGSIVNGVIVQPLKKVTSKVTDFVYQGTKAIVSAPFQLVGALYKRAIHKNGLIVRGIKSIIHFTKNAIGKTFQVIGKGAFGALKLGAKGIGAVTGVVKGVAGRAKDKFEERNPGLVSKFNEYMRKRRIAKEEDPLAKEFLESREEGRKKRQENKANRRDRRNLDKNRRMMAKILGYDEKYFTEETMAKAEAIAGKKINWAGTKDNRKFDQTPEQRRAEFLKQNRNDIISHGETSNDIEIRKLTESTKTNKKLDSIYDILFKSYKELKGDGFSDDEIAEKLGETRDNLSENEKAAKLVKYNRKHGGAASDLSKDNDELLSDVKNWGDKVVDELSDTKKSTSDKVANAIRKKGILGLIRGRSKKGSSDLDKWFNDTSIDQLEDPETNAKLMDMLFDDNHKRAKGGNMKKGQPYLVGEGGSDPSAAEVVIPDQSSTVLSQKDGGIKVTLAAVTGNALTNVMSFFSKAKDKLSNLNVFTRNKNKDQEEMSEAENRGTYASQLIAKQKQIEAKKQDERDKTQSGILKALLALGKGNKKHHSLWETIFSKKGLIGAGLISLIPFLWKNKDTILGAISSIASAVGSILSSMGEQASWTSKNNARDNGNTAFEQLGKEVDRTANVTSDLLHGNLIGAAGEFVLDDGAYDAQSGGRAQLLINGTRKGVKKAKPYIHLASKGAKAIGTSVGKASKTVGNAIGKGTKYVWNKIDPSVAGKLGRGELTNSVDLLGSALNENSKTTKFGEAFGKIKNGFKSKFGKNVASSSINMGTSSLDLLAEAIPESATSISDDIGMAALQEANGIMTSSVDELASTATKAAKGKVTTESVEKIAEKTSSTMASKVCKIISGFFEKVATKCASKAATNPKVIQKGLKGFLSKVTQCVTKKIGTISGKISAAFAGKTAAAVATAGLSTVGFVTIGFINGAGKGATARLFQVSQDKVDAKMRIISAAFNAISAGTVTGSVIDVVCGLVADVLGVDMLNIIACTIYKAMSSDDKDNALEQAQAEWKNAYLDYQDKELDKNYVTQKKLGNIDSSMTAEEYKEGVKSGKYKATYKGFDDWNADKNKSLGSKIGSGVTKGWRATKSFFTGKTSYKDANGNVYADIGDNQYEVYGADGKKIGVVAKDSVDVSSMKKTTKGGIKNGIKSAGRAIGNFASNAKDSVVNFGKKAFNKGSEVLSNVKDAVTSFGKGAGETIGGFIKKIGNVGSAIMTGQKQIEANFNNKEIDFKGYFSADVNPLKDDHPLHGLVGGLLNGSKVVSFIPLVAKGVLKKAGSAIGKFVKGMISKVQKTTSDISTQQATLKTIATSGNLTALNNFKYEPADDNPMAGISKAVVGINKVFMYPGTLMHLGANIVKKFIGTQIDKVKASVQNISPEMSKISDLSSKGIGSLNSYKPTISEDNPLAGFTKGILTIDKLFHYPNALLHTAGNTIKKAFNSVISGVKKIGTGSSAAISEMQGFMKSGDLTSILKYKPAVAKGTPLEGFINGILNVGRIVMIPGTAIKKVGNTIHDKISSGINKIKDVGTELKNYTTTLLSYTDNDKDMSGFDKEKMGDNSVVGKIIGPMIKNVLKIYVNLKRGLNSVGDFIEDKVDDLKDAAGNAKDTVVNGAKSVGSKVASVANNIGTSIMNFGRGGRGDGEEPDVVNGHDYYSQNDSKWKSKPYISSKAKDGSTMGDSGCGPTAMSMVVSDRNSKVSPTQMAQLASQSGFRDETGTNAGFIGYAGDVYGLQHQDVANPSADYIRNQVANGNSVVLNGYSKNKGSGAFTTAGHYVVAVGTDKNGNILVNDPRGKEYSKAYKPETLAKETSQSWSFSGGTGFRGKNVLGGFGKAIKRKLFKKLGGRGVSGDWLSIVRSVKQLVAAQHPTYNQSGSMTINYNGKDIKLRPDCSGLVGCMLRIYGAIPEGQNVTSSSLCSNNAIQDGFTYGGWTGWENLQEGDIITRSGHVEVFCRNENGKHYVYNGGSTKALCSPDATVTGHPDGYTVVWRPGNAGTGGSVVTGSSSSSGGLTDVMSNISNVFSKYSTAAMNGILTGNFDASQITWDDSSGSSSSGTDYSGSVPSAINTGDVAKTLWNYFTGSAGYSKAATAAILGNLQQESGLNPANTSGKVAGGLAQWERFDKKTGRWKNLYDYATSKGKDWTDAAIQAEFINKELQSSAINSYFGKDVKYGHGISGSTLTNAGATPTTFEQWKQSNDVDMATRQFEGAFERAGKPMIDKRVAYAKQFYNTYAGGGNGEGKHGKSYQHTFKKADLTSSSTLNGIKASHNFDTAISNTKTMSTQEKVSYGVGSSNNKTTTNASSGFDEKALAMMETMIDVLKQIGVNTSKLEELKNSSVSVNNGRNIVVNKNTTNQTTPQVKESKNSTLAEKIAKGYN